MNAPIGVSEYTLSKALPKNLKTKLPTIEEIEANLNDGDEERSLKNSNKVYSKL